MQRATEVTTEKAMATLCTMLRAALTLAPLVAGCAHAPIAEEGARAPRNGSDFVFVTGSRIARPPGREVVSMSPLRVYTRADIAGTGRPDVGFALEALEPAAR